MLQSVYPFTCLWTFAVSSLGLLPIKLQWKLGTQKRKPISRHFRCSIPPTQHLLLTIRQNVHLLGNANILFLNLVSTRFCPVLPERPMAPGDKSTCLVLPEFCCLTLSNQHYIRSGILSWGCWHGSHGSPLIPRWMQMPLPEQTNERPWKS